MNSKITTNPQISTIEPKKQRQKQTNKQLEQEQNHRNGDDREGYQWGGVRTGEKGQGIRSINGRYKIDRGR